MTRAISITCRLRNKGSPAAAPHCWPQTGRLFFPPGAGRGTPSLGVVAARETNVRVEVPNAAADRPPLVRVGIIAGVGFAIGIAWPWLAGVKLVPSAPVDEEPAAAPVASATASSAPAEKPKVVTAKGKNAPPKPERTKEQTIEVGEAIIVSCRDQSGRKHEDCDKVPFDPLAKPRILTLANCPAAKGASQMLSIGFDLDFEKNEVTEISSGKSTTFPDNKTEALLDCARKEFASVKLTGLAHGFTRYSIFYFAQFVPAGTVVGGEAEEPASEVSGFATVGWDSALVREAPEDGEIQTRLRYGTRVAVTARKGKWYLVQYDAKGTKGWIHKNAIGM